MTNTNSPLDARWAELQSHANRLCAADIRNLVRQGGPARLRQLVLDHGFLRVDAARQRLDDAALQSLFDLAADAGVLEQRDRMFAGEPINLTENRQVTHWAWRLPEPPASVAATRRQMDIWVQRLLSRATQPSGRPIKSILHLGIGGSDLGPRMVADTIAYSVSVHSQIDAYFAANVDGHELQQALDRLDPKATIVSIASKTFTTRETLRNAQTVMDWLRDGGVRDPLSHCVAITSDADKAIAWGIEAENIFTFEDSVGGRFSLWSPVGLPARLAIGETEWQRLLAGAHAADEHFRAAPLQSNLPVLLALLDVWNHSVLQLPARVIAPYDARMGLLVAHIQQLEMESLGKQLGPDGQLAPHAHCPMIWGEPGTNGQHAYFQWLHQAATAVALEVLLVARPRHDFDAHHAILLANGLAQADAFAFGKSPEGDLAQGIEGRLRTLPGGRPVTLWCYRELDAYALGYVIATLEHKVVCLGHLWGVNAFDQFGVELGKTMAKTVEAYLADTNLDFVPPHLAGTLDWLKKASL
jgi:glucose-6-phosphate isomerase